MDRVWQRVADREAARLRDLFTAHASPTVPPGRRWATRWPRWCCWALRRWPCWAGGCCCARWGWEG
ncbi:hypothetical protein [Deinococcus multiflagellatus]|uniref:Uncharacterized protein n=1 Tax=Deinococcus multiflagellatus TaxID=1656887 RepID=A0ABW1ZQ42_9DEIO